jgi:hypothetical protein
MELTRMDTVGVNLFVVEPRGADKLARPVCA